MKNLFGHPALVPLGLVSLVNTLGISLLIPVLPTIVEQFGGGYLMYGVLLSLYSLCQFFSAPMRGMLSDRYGRKHILMITQRGTLISRVIFGCAWFMGIDGHVLWVGYPLWCMIIARVCDGFTAGNNAVVSAYISDISHDQQTKITYFGMMAAMMGVGVMLGPLLGGVSASFSSWGNFGTIISAALLSLATLIILAIKLPATTTTTHQSRPSLRSSLNIPRHIKQSISQDASLGVMWLLMGVFYVLFLGYTTVYVLHATEAFQLSLVHVGWIGTGIGLVYAIQQFIVLPSLHKSFSGSQLLLLAHGCMAMGLGLITYSQTVFGFVIASIILTTGVAWSMTLFNTILSHHAQDDNEGWLFGLKDSLMAAASIIAPLLGAGLYSVFSQEIFIIYALIALAMTILIHRSIQKNIL